MTLRSWADIFPLGRDLFYEGDDPEGFAAQIRSEVGLDVSAGRGWAHARGWRFHCPPEFLDVIYGSERFPLGS